MSTSSPSPNPNPKHLVYIAAAAATPKNPRRCPKWPPLSKRRPHREFTPLTTSNTSVHRRTTFHQVIKPFHSRLCHLKGREPRCLRRSQPPSSNRERATPSHRCSPTNAYASIDVKWRSTISTAKPSEPQMRERTSYATPQHHHYCSERQHQQPFNNETRRKPQQTVNGHKRIRREIGENRPGRGRKGRGEKREKKWQPD